MGIGATIAINRVAMTDLSDLATEVRVHQFADRATTYSIRFEADICGGDFEIVDSPFLQPRNAANNKDNEITIIAESGTDAACLVHGVIEQRKVSLAQGGPGSSIEIAGSDRRITLDRNHRQTKYSGRASDAVSFLLSDAGFEPDVASTEVRYDENTQTLNQSESDLSFIQKIAKQNGFNFYIECEATAERQGPIRVRETAHVRPSPPREQFNSGPPKIRLAPERDAVTLIINVDDARAGARNRCTNVLSFDLDTDGERPTSVVGTRISDTGTDLQTADAAGNPLSELSGSSLTSLTGGREQAISLVTAGDATEHRVRAEAALLEAGWFVTARATTTVHSLGSIIVPNTVVRVEGLGRQNSGPYFVSSVVHALDAAVHRMEIELLRNSLTEV